MPKKHQSKYPGVRFVNHETRVFNRKPDQYFSIRYRVAGGKRLEEALGWASKGWTAQKAHEILSILQGNIRTGNGPQTLKEIRERLAAEQTALAEKKAEHDRGAMTFGRLADLYIVAKKNKKSLHDDLQRLRDHVRPVLDHVPLVDVHHGHLDQIAKNLEDKNLAPATIKHCLILVRAIFNYARKTPFTQAEPAKKIFSEQNPMDGYTGIPQSNNRRETWFNNNQIKSILEKSESIDSESRDFIKVAMFTGMRRGEIASITESDISIGTKTITLRSYSEKNKQGRVVHVDDSLISILKARLTGNPDRRIFQIHPDTVTHKFSEIMESLGYKSPNRRNSACFHTLRHTLITHLVMGGLPLPNVQTVSGHKTFDIVLRYAKSCDPQIREALSNFSQKVAHAAQSEEQTHHHADDTQASD